LRERRMGVGSGEWGVGSERGVAGGGSKLASKQWAPCVPNGTEYSCTVLVRDIRHRTMHACRVAMP